MPRPPPPPLAPLSHEPRLVSSNTHLAHADGHRRVSVSPAVAPSPSPSSGSPAASFGGGGGGGAAARRARQNFSRSSAASLVAGLRHVGQLPLTLSHARMHPAWNTCAQAMTRASRPCSIVSQHTRHTAVSSPSPTREIQSSSPAVHRGSDAIVALDAGPGVSSHADSSCLESAGRDAASLSGSKPPSSTSSREAVPRRGDPPASRPRRYCASAPPRRRASQA